MRKIFYSTQHMLTKSIKKPLLIHIGTHKTGSSSFQAYLADHSTELKQSGFSVLPDKYAHTAACLSVRDELPIPGADHLIDKESRIKTEKNLRDCISKFYIENQTNALILSCEHFSYFRTIEEVDRLLSFFACHDEIRVFTVVRDKGSFLNSYKAQIRKTGHGPIKDDTSSPFYCGKDTWLVDYDGMKTPWVARTNDFQIISYENTDDVVTELILAFNLPDFRGGKPYRVNVRTSETRNIAIQVLKKCGMYGIARAIYRQFT